MSVSVKAIVILSLMGLLHAINNDKASQLLPLLTQGAGVQQLAAPAKGIKDIIAGDVVRKSSPIQSEIVQAAENLPLSRTLRKNAKRKLTKRGTESPVAPSPRSSAYYEEQMPVVVAAQSTDDGNGNGNDNDDYELPSPSEWNSESYYPGADNGAADADGNNYNANERSFNSHSYDRMNYGNYNGDEDFYRQRFYATTKRYSNDYNEYEEERPQPSPAPAAPTSSSASDLLNYIHQAKQIWDIFTAMNTAWNAVGQHQQEQQLKAHHQRQEPNRPPSTTKASKIGPDSKLAGQANETAVEVEAEADRTKRTIGDGAVSEGRYIKGDPLKGYYDFVITEGSYKFWAAFQVGTAILIIYSTFAAIYYSKVNPLVSDYDYTDYLGGGRALSDDADFVDDESGGAAGAHNGGPTSIWSKLTEGDWMRSAGHTVQFVLDAVDKLPQ